MIWRKRLDIWGAYRGTKFASFRATWPAHSLFLRAITEPPMRSISRVPRGRKV
jgi:hypothetical protein